MLNDKGQSSIEFLLIIVLVIVLVILIFNAFPKDINEIVALGIAKNNLDEFALKTNYLGDYNLHTIVSGSDLNIFVSFSEEYNSAEISSFEKNIIKEVKKVTNFENIYISCR